MNSKMDDVIVETLAIGRILRRFDATQWDYVRCQSEIADTDVREWKIFTIQELKGRVKLLELLLEERVLILRNSQDEASKIEPDEFAKLAISSTRYACISPIEESLSTIANSASKRLFYDMITPPCVRNTYIPNKRIQNLMNIFHNISSRNENARNIELKIRTNGILMQSWPYPPGGAESKINDPLLSIYITEICKLFSDPGVVCQSNQSFPFHTQLCSPLSKQEHHIIYHNSVILASEAKGVESSETVALVQCTQACSDAALHLFKEGLDPDDCVVPGVICCGETLSVVAVYFAPTTFPVLVYLSRALCICACEDRKDLSRWAVALFEFGMNTINLLNRPNKSIVPLADIQFRLSMNQFFKSVRNVIKTEGSSVDTVLNDTSCARMNLNSILHVYFLLSSAPSIHRYVLFPVGVVTCPSADNPYGAEIRQLLIGAMKPHFQGLVETSSFTHLPFLMYPELRASEGWHSSTLWPPSPLRDAYLLELGCAVAALNKAKVAHMDLRPANILWREVPVGIGGPFIDEGGTGEFSTCVQVQLIDFEDAVPFEMPIKLSHKYADHSSYPDYSKNSKVDAISKEVPVASQRHNNFFLRAISAWLLAGQRTVSFDIFMSSVSDEERRRFNSVDNELVESELDIIGPMEKVNI